MNPGNRLAAQAAAIMLAAFDAYLARFAEVTGRAKGRFETRDWRGAQTDVAVRLALYPEHVNAVLGDLGRALGPHVFDASVWAAARECYASLVVGRDDCGVAETFFNSVTRRIFTTVGVDPRIEFLASSLGTGDSTVEPCPEPRPIFRTITAPHVDEALVRELLGAFSWGVPYRNLGEAAVRVAAAMRAGLAELGAEWVTAHGVAVELLDSVFYRNKGAYLVGRLRRGEGSISADAVGEQSTEVVALVLALLNTERGIVVDAVLMSADEASVVFGFSWTYFRAATNRPRAVVEFLHSIMPHKRVDELYTSIGHNKHGKTELYRGLVRHLAESDACFERAEGDEGLVMSVFALPSFNVVFKIIKDTFGQPKTTTRRAVMDKYRLVFSRDRVGRLADAQDFEHLAFPASRFPEPLLAHLLETAGESVRVEGDQVVLVHCYTERRVTPLNLFLKRAAAGAAREAIVEYGNAIKDLAGANIFTGDMLPKNFGVSRHGRVIFYDYDELTLLTECNFRRLPRASDLDEEMAAEPWFYVGEHDVFPEEWAAFLVPPGELRDVFLAAHADLLGIDFWREMQERQRAGEMPDVFPYRPERRLAWD
jgi:isocitrate dehydrogenase kinase/phosphatase